MNNASKWVITAQQAVAEAQQHLIEVGDIVRSYDFPGMRADCYIEGLVTEIEPGDRIKVHVTREVSEGKDMQVTLVRHIMWSPLGVSSLSGVPCVFLIAKGKVRS